MPYRRVSFGSSHVGHTSETNLGMPTQASHPSMWAIFLKFSLGRTDRPDRLWAYCRVSKG
ncbi:Cell cycle checkpoint RAD17 [Gossypium arboreum]|uniref:Cell cycle checkpoint RAD17 n=1 Tax=Gossypium arboreum TaxID=29729 RepID=A0A0B0Q0D6_GOSAR|nr:Cell cycle checkpoint RAD17 [Gossypium arboreum]